MTQYVNFWFILGMMGMNPMQNQQNQQMGTNPAMFGMNQNDPSAMQSMMVMRQMYGGMNPMQQQQMVLSNFYIVFEMYFMKKI